MNRLTQTIRRAVRGAGLATVLALVGALAPAAHAVTTQLWLPFPSTATLNGESVGFSGAVHLVVNADPTDPTVPPNPVRIQTNLVNVVGIGETTGATYRVTGAASFTSDQAPPSTYVFDAAYPADPHRLFIRLRHTVNVNAEGVGTSADVQIAPPGD